MGTCGHHAQGFLRKFGGTRSYLMVNTFLYPIYGQFPLVRDLSRSEPIQGFRDAFLDRVAQESPLEAVIAVGAAGAVAVERWTNRPAIPVCEITHPSARDQAPLLANWDAGPAMLNGTVNPGKGIAPDPTPNGNDWTAADEVPIPRRDLPFGVPEWHGVGSHASRGRQGNSTTDPKVIVRGGPRLGLTERAGPTQRRCGLEKNTDQLYVLFALANLVIAKKALLG